MAATDVWDAYERISEDPSDTQAGVNRQREDNDRAVAQRGGTVGEHHVENDTSAFKQRPVQMTDPYGNSYTAYRVLRPVWAQAIHRLRTGEAKHLMVWDLDRLARDPRDLEDAIEAVEHYGAEIRSATAGDIDLSTDSGRMAARMLVVMANKASADTARRVKRQKESRLAAGLPPGSRWRTFGYNRDWSLNPAEAPIVAEVFERVAGGESVNSVTQDLVARDVQRVSGEPWRYQATARMLDSRIYAGRLSHKGADAGPAKVTAIVSEGLLEAAQSRQRAPGRVNGRKHLLSGLVVCGRCQTVMTVTGHRSGAWVCNRQAGGCGNVRIKRAWLEEPVENWVKTRLLVEDLRPVAIDQPRPEGGITEALREVEQRQALTRAAMTKGDLDYADGLPMLADLNKQRTTLLKSQATADAAEQQQFLKTLTDYEQAPVLRRAAEVGRRISAVVVSPTVNRGSNKFDASRFEVVLTDGRRVSGLAFIEEAARFSDLSIEAHQQPAV